MMFTSAPTVLYEPRLMVTWSILSAHLWDLQDKRISTLSYLLASGFQLFYIVILSVTVSLALAYETLGWQWESFWIHNLFCIMTTIAALQLGKTIAAGMSSCEASSALTNVLLYLGFVFSGVFVNPTKVPSSLTWLMYVSPFFWGNAGSQLSMLQYTKLGEQPCQSFASCLGYSPSVMAQLMGYASTATARTSMFVLVSFVIVMVFIEYILLRRKVVQRSNYTRVVAEEGDDEKSEEIVEYLYESSTSSMRFSVLSIARDSCDLGVRNSFFDNIDE